MQYVELQPAPALRGRARFWRLTGQAPPRENGAAELEPVLPDGCVELIVHLGDPFWNERDGRRELQPRALLAGPTTTPVRLAPSGRVDVIGVRLEAGVVAGLVDAPLGALVDRLPELASVASAFARGLGEELADPRRGESWSDVLERRLLRSLRAAEPRVERAVARVRASGGQTPVAALAADAGLSPRQLERRFRERVGLGPKTFARLVRFQRALGLLRRPESSMAAVAAGCGYFDQAHLVRDFRQFAGDCPSRFRAAESELTGHFVDGAP